MSAEFCDTNVFAYAYDVSAGAERGRAKRLVERLWDSGDGVVSVQVLQQLYVTLTRKALPDVRTPSPQPSPKGRGGRPLAPSARGEGRGEGSLSYTVVPPNGGMTTLWR